MDEREVAGVVNGSEEFQRGMECAKAVAEGNRAGIAVGVVAGSARGAAEIGVLRGIKACADAAVVRVGSVLGNPNPWAARRILRIKNGDDGVQGVIGAAQPDEENLPAVGADAAGSERALHDERNVGEAGERGGHADLRGTIEERAPGEDVDVTVLHRANGLIVPGNVGGS